jgi:hypothetical protein
MNTHVQHPIQHVILASLLTVLALLATTTPASAASPSSSAQKSSCHELLVHLNGNALATSQCLDQKIGASTGFKPATAQDNCTTIGALKIFSDANYQGNVICFTGTGSVNLTSYWIAWPFVSWNDVASSFDGGCMAGTFYANTNNWGASEAFGNGNNAGAFDGVNGHLPNDTLSSLTITRSPLPC